MSDGSRTFRVSFPEDGLVKLRGILREKLKEYMGDYTDDTLVDYVIVLLRNGRSETEAGNELKAFLEDDSISFTSWLWDHLSSNLDIYLQPNGAVSEREHESDLVEKPWDQIVHSDQLDDALDIDSDNEVESPSELSKIRHNREWKGLMQEKEPLILRSTVVVSDHIMKKSTMRNGSLRRRSVSPKPRTHRKRNHQDERSIVKRVAASRPMLGATSRLLQFAVRDAVNTVQQSFCRPAPKRLRSVVSSSIEDSSATHLTQIKRLAPRVVGNAATAIKAATEAAEDVKLKRSLSISGRLHQQSEKSVINVPPSNIKSSLDEVDEDYGQSSRLIDRRSKHGVIAENMMLDENSGLPYNFGSNYERNNSMGNIGSLVGEVSENSLPVLKDSNSLMFQCSVPHNVNNNVARKTLEDQEESTTCTTKAQKILNISVNVNTWKPPDFQVSRETTDSGNQVVSRSIEKGGGNFHPQLAKGIDNNLLTTKNEILQSRNSQDIPKIVLPQGSHPSTRPSDDADSRTVFVSNVHFGATKDTLSSHFNKFGDVLKVVIMTDGATGQPTGSAYVEFLRKESTELALSLNGTSFMSRILKVVRRSVTSQETTGTSRPRIVRPSSFAPRNARMSFSRGLVSPFRGRLSVKPGARSLQWKRDSPQTPSKEGAKNIQNSQVSSNALSSPIPRNHTYVRNEAKSDASASLA